MLDDEPTSTTSDRDTAPTDTTDPEQPAPSQPTRRSARATRQPSPPPAMSFMAPPDPVPVPVRQPSDDGITGTVPAADGAEAPNAARATKAAKAGKATKPGRAAGAATKGASTADGDSGPRTGDLVDDSSPAGQPSAGPDSSGSAADGDPDADVDGGNRRRRGRRGRGRGKTGEDADGDGLDNAAAGADGPDTDDGPGRGPEDEDDDDGDGEGGSSTRRRRRRRRRADEDGDGPGRGDGAGGAEEVRGISGSTRLEAKRQRRRDGRETGRRRAPILSEAEFLTRREAVNRAMVIRQTGERIQIAVLEDDIVVEHYITQTSSNSFAGNVYLGKVQNVLPSMEAAFVDIGKGRNAVLYAGEVNWDAAGLEGKSRNIETAMKSGDSVVVQVTKDPMGHKGARLTSQVSLPGRYLVFVPNGSMTGISRKLPDVERSRLKAILKKIVPEDAGVIIRTAAEGASEEELTRDVKRLTAQWEVIQKKAAAPSTSAPSLLYQEPDLAIRVIRDVFNEDFTRMIVAGDDVWDTVEAYVAHVAPDLADRLIRHTGESDVFADLRVDEQLAKALDRKVWLPSGGSLVIDRTEAMTVVDVNTGKYTGSGGNLEQTVTRNNLEAAEEIVRQLRLRDIGGIIVIDFIDMVLESNRDLVLRRLTECLGRDRTRHQVAEVTSLGLIQMTRKRVGQGLLEVYSEPCEHCNGRGIIVHAEPVDEKRRRASGDNSRGAPHAEPIRGGDRAERGARGRGRTSHAESVPAETDNGADPDTALVLPTGEVDMPDRPPAADPVAEAQPRPLPVAQELPPPQSPSTPSDGAESADVRAWTDQEFRADHQIVTATPRRRGRRGASRPAGPPVTDG